MSARTAGPSSPRVVTVKILRLGPDGEGVARLNGEDILVPYVIPGERVEVAVRRGRDGLLSGDVIRVVEASPDRITPRCRHFGPCGGCSWQHIAYPAQLGLKQRLLQDLLDGALGPSAPRVLSTAATPPGDAGDRGLPEPWGYRDKVSFVFAPAGRDPLVMGHYRRGTRTAFAAEECPVHADAGNRIAFRLRDALLRARIPAATADGQQGIARHAVVRVSEATGDALATLVVTETVKPLRRVTSDMERQDASRPGAQSDPGGAQGSRDSAAGSPARLGFHLNVHDRADGFLFGRETKRLFGASEIRERVANVTFLLSPTSFFQTNVRVAALMVDHVLRLLPAEGYRRVLDLYSGVGLFALPLASRGQHVTAVEENRDAMAAAEAAARFNRLPEGVFRATASRVEAAMARLTPRPGAPAWDAVILDPPREGCPPAVLDWILHTLHPRLVVYVSCNPHALAADLRSAPPAYAIREVRPYDMFPHTAHIEAIAVLGLQGGTA